MSPFRPNVILSLVTVISLIELAGCKPAEPAPALAPVASAPEPAPAPPPPPTPAKPALPEKVILDGKVLQFAPGGSKLSPKGAEEVRKVAEKIRSQEGAFSMVVTGYTSSAGSRTQNIVLSHNRADAVAKILVRAGISIERISVGGLGPEKPVADNKTAEGRSKNNRIEIEFREP